MKTTLLRGIIIAAAACLTAANADHMSPWGPGWANMPNDIHNTRIDTRLADDDEALRNFVIYGEGANSTNRFLFEESAALEAAHQAYRLAARLDPLPDFLGGGWARYTMFDDETLVSSVLNINVRLRLIEQNGSVANDMLGLTADNADVAAVSAYFRDYATLDYAKCTLVFDSLVYGDDDVADYATYSLSLKEDRTGLIDGTGGCTAVAGIFGGPILPSAQLGDVVDIAVQEIRPVLMGSF